MTHNLCPVSVEELRDRFVYDPESGCIFLRVATLRFAAGTLVGRRHTAGYLVVEVKKDGNWRKLYAHRVAWAMTHGEWPAEVMDHINGVRSDNRLVNLRAASRTQNCANSATIACSSSGFKGVYFNKAAKKWQAAIKLRGVRRYLGVYSTAEQAHEVYMQAAREMFGEFACNGKRTEASHDVV